MNAAKTKIILFFSAHYILNEIDTLKGIQRDIAFKLKFYMKRTKFTEDEHKLMQRLDPEIKKILNTDISHQVFGFELLKLWALSVPRKSQPILGIRQNKLTAGKAYYATERLKLKSKDPERYKDIVEIMDKSAEIANQIFNLIKDFK